ncbi:MAG: xanthine dehydrogenase family protein subunit M [Chloroflexi bacterium]|nr:xanthine dehydrogenase family protein subunit M [Chloroflexota bacterium]
MKPAPFRYFAPSTLQEALDLLAEHGDAAKVLAGGQSLTPMMNFRLVTPAILIDLNPISELSFIREQDGHLVIGAMARQRHLERDPRVAAYAPLIAETMPFVAHPQIRNRGTVGGSLAHADPAAELPAVMIALDAEFKLSSQKGERQVRAADFFIGLFTTALDPTELLTEITLPTRMPRTGHAFQEVSRRHGDFALAGVATTVALDEQGACRDARIVYLGLGMRPIAADAAAKQMIGAMPTAEAIQHVANAVDAEIEPSTDIHASAEFRRHLARVLTRRALESAIARARVGAGSPRPGLGGTTPPLRELKDL